MKIALFLLVILSASFGFSRADHNENSWDKKETEVKACVEKCSVEDLKEKYVCHGNGLDGEPTRCHFNCASPIYNYKEVECKRGGHPYCYESECPPDEKITKEGERWCDKDHEKSEYKSFFESVCQLKCTDGNYKKDAEYVSCSSLYFEYVQKYGS